MKREKEGERNCWIWYVQNLTWKLLHQHSKSTIFQLNQTNQQNQRIRRNICCVEICIASFASNTVLRYKPIIIKTKEQQLSRSDWILIYDFGVVTTRICTQNMWTYKCGNERIYMQLRNLVEPIATSNHRSLLIQCIVAIKLAFTRFWANSMRNAVLHQLRHIISWKERSDSKWSALPKDITFRSFGNGTDDTARVSRVA